MSYDLTISHLCIYLKEIKRLTWKNTYIPMFTEALFSTAEIQKQPKCPSKDKWIKMIWCIYTMEYYSATIKNENFLGQHGWI